MLIHQRTKSNFTEYLMSWTVVTTWLGPQNSLSWHVYLLGPSAIGVQRCSYLDYVSDFADVMDHGITKPRRTDHGHEMSEERIREVFSMFDKDGDGTIDLLELTPIMAVLGLNSSTKRLKIIMTEADKDRNGKLDIEEFSALMGKYLRSEEEAAALEMTGSQQAKENASSRRKHRSIDPTIKEVFSRYDDDNDGTIDAEELLPIMKILGSNPTHQEMRKIMKEADLDGSGKLDLYEFNELMKKYLLIEEDTKLGILDAFRVIDKDNSGTIDMKELKEILLKAGQDISDDDLHDIFKKLDVNGDGLLDIDEFSKIAKSGFI